MTETARAATDPFPGGVDVKIAISRDAVGLEIEVKYVCKEGDSMDLTVATAVSVAIAAFTGACVQLNEHGYEPGPFAKKSA